ncbi:hypothetical protein EDF56_106332 [Novosphingobium sp. PhB165]|uniref:hypothetical protein n=1 Tax=Novosphingobium sp. PhB165 TaxID=2485105 RepID=UPI001046976E|nr:hypothetical protein [Novosphingobium sp. PhB165]TCM17216.1 hypothetical protein EDF56_106332 [Novosphingobium sp. PhB165]
MPDLIAIKPMSYATRRLAAGARFTARSASHARALVAIGKARLADTDSDALPAPKVDLDALREEYVIVLGKKPYHGWTAEALAEKIAEAKAA